MRTVRLLVIVPLAAVAVAASGCGGVSTQPDGAWSGCGNVARPSAVQVRRTVPSAMPAREVLLATERRPAVARGLYDDMCVIAGHPPHLPPGAMLNCPADFGLLYRGVFYTGRRTLAVFGYAASSCAGLSVTVGADQASTQNICCNRLALAAQVSLDASLATVFGVPPGAIQGHVLPVPAGTGPAPAWLRTVEKICNVLP